MLKPWFRRVIPIGVASLISLNAFGSPPKTRNPTPPKLQVAMMGGGMMGPGMMGGNSTSSTLNGNASESTARPLETYIGHERLACFSCHAIAGKGMGPSFIDIAQRYKGNPGAEKILTQSIDRGVSRKWSGYGRMPEGLATPEQSRELAHLIMALSRAH